MGRYRKYLLTGEKVPRSTLWMRRHRAERKESESISTNGTNQFSRSTGNNHLEVLETTLIGNSSSKEESAATCVEVSHEIFHTGDYSAREEQDAVITTEDTLCSDVVNQISNDCSVTGEVDVECDVSECLDAEEIDVECDNPVQNDIKRLATKLCACVDATVGDVIFMCLVLGLRHNLTWEAQVDILKMFKTIFGLHEMPSSKSGYLRCIEMDRQEVKYHIFCPDCEVYLGVREEQEKYKVCAQCNRRKEVVNSSNFFVSLSLEEQLKSLLKNETVASSLLTHRFTREKECDDALEDIYDGEEYRKHCVQGGILSSPLNFSWSFFVDGISTGKATGKTMWPYFLTLNELPYAERSKYIFLGGLYIGPKDPNSLIFMQPFVEELNKLSSLGFSWNLSGKSVISKVIPLCGVVDSVARWQLLNMQSFHAFYGCTFCYQKQECTAPRKRRFNIMSEKADDRTAESTYFDALQAYERRTFANDQDRHYRGVKGPSCLINLKYFNLIWGFSVDYMHCLLLGCIKTHMEHLFDSTRKKFWIGINDNVGLSHIMQSIDNKLLKIQPPTGITRAPRSISMYKLWKASEWRSWLLFYCIPCLDGLLKEKHLVHLAMVCKATKILLQKSFTKADVEHAHNLYIGYCYLFQTYFDVKHTIYNIHLLTHVCKCVLNWGPLWAHNAFCYEGENRFLLQLYKSPHNVLSQIVRKYLIYGSLPTVMCEIVSSKLAVNFSEDILEQKLKRVVRSGKCNLSGKLKSVNLTQKEKECLLEYRNVTEKDCSFFQRMLFKNQMRFTCSDYSTGKRNDDSILHCKNGDIVKIKYIVLLLQTRSVVILGLRVKTHKRPIINDAHVTISHILKVKRLSRLVCVAEDDIQSQCIMMKTSCADVFVCAMPFGCYGD